MWHNIRKIIFALDTRAKDIFVIYKVNDFNSTNTDSLVLAIELNFQIKV